MPGSQQQRRTAPAASSSSSDDEQYLQTPSDFEERQARLALPSALPERTLFSGYCSTASDSTIEYLSRPLPTRRVMRQHLLPTPQDIVHYNAAILGTQVQQETVDHEEVVSTTAKDNKPN